MSVAKIKKQLQALANPDKAKVLSSFFKTGLGQYGAGDKFLGITVPQQRAVAKQYAAKLALADIAQLLASPYHEHRLTGALILVEQYQYSQQLGDAKKQKAIFDFYFKNSQAFNNWDLVDLTADKIVGNHLLNKSRQQLFTLAKSKNLWSRRISIVATYAFIKQNQFTDTLKLAKLLLGDSHDLMHKAVGWMLREVGKRDEAVLKKFLQDNWPALSRTTLRYAIERLPVAERQAFLYGQFTR